MGRCGAGVVQGFVTRFGTRFAKRFVVCVTFFGRAWNTVFKPFANQGAYFNSVLNMFSKAPLRYALVVCLHFVPPNHECLMNFYFKSEKY